MATDASLAETLARLRVSRDAGRPPEPPLVAEAIRHLESVAGAAMARADRDKCIRRAAAFLDGSAWQKANALRAESIALARAWKRLSQHTPARWTVQGELHAAALIDDLPGSQRQFFRVLTNPRSEFQSRVHD